MSKEGLLNISKEHPFKWLKKKWYQFQCIITQIWQLKLAENKQKLNFKNISFFRTQFNCNINLNVFINVNTFTYKCTWCYKNYRYKKVKFLCCNLKINSGRKWKKNSGLVQGNTFIKKSLEGYGSCCFSLVGVLFTISCAASKN